MYLEILQSIWISYTVFIPFFFNAIHFYSNIKRGLPTKPVVKPIPQIPEKPKLEINLQKVYKKISPIMKISNTHNKSVQCKVILENCPTNIEDPNDIEFKTLAKVETCEVPKYSSPLDYMER